MGNNHRIPLNLLAVFVLVPVELGILTLAEMILKFTRKKAEEKKVDLPGGVIATLFDPTGSAFMVTFSSKCGECSIEKEFSIQKYYL